MWPDAIRSENFWKYNEIRQILYFKEHYTMYVGFNRRKELFMKKTIITVTGKDTVGIIAKICNYLAENSVNIEDISQTILQGYFHMMMITDASKASKNTATLAEELQKVGEEIGVMVHCQREDIFDMMHRV